MSHRVAKVSHRAAMVSHRVAIIAHNNQFCNTNTRLQVLSIVLAFCRMFNFEIQTINRHFTALL